MGLPSLGWLRLLTQPWCSIFSWWTFSLLFATELSSNSSTRAILVVATFYILGAKCARTSSTKVKRSREEEFWINSKIKKKCAIVHPHLGSSRSPTRFSLPIPRGCREGRFFRRLLCRSLSALNALIFFPFFTSSLWEKVKYYFADLFHKWWWWEGTPKPTTGLPAQ